MNYQKNVLMDMINDSLQANGWARFRVVSNSMLPLIRKDDWVTASVLSKQAGVHFGEIILFRRQNELIIHRVIKSGSGWMITKGDRCLSADVPVNHEDVLARVISIERGNRIVNLQTRRWYVLGFMMAVISGLLAGISFNYKKLTGKKMVRLA
jgi:signal peptidase I